MPKNEMTPLLGSTAALMSSTTQVLSGGLARQVRREVEQLAAQKVMALAEVAARAEVEMAAVAARATVASAEEFAEAHMTSQRMTNAAMLDAQAVALAQATPSAGRHLAMLAESYVLGAIQRSNKGL